MPELPEIVVIKEKLNQQIKGKMVKRFQVLKPYLLKNYFESEKLEGERVESVHQRGKYLILELSGFKIYIHLMLRGFVELISEDRQKRSASAIIHLDDGTKFVIGEKGHKKYASIYIFAREEDFIQSKSLGIEPLDPGFTLGRLTNLIKISSRQLKRFLCDQKMIAGIGNAYADEILWDARLSPFRLTMNLNEDEINQLYRSIKKTLRWAIQEVKKEGVREKRDFPRIHNKKGRPCPRCGSLIQSVSFSNSETYYCPECQVKGKRLKDRRLSKLYR